MNKARARRLDDAFGALSDPTRRKVVELLGKAPLRASELADATDASRPGMSRHLKILREAGLVREEEDALDARARVYCLEPDAFEGVKHWLERVETFWAEQLHSFKALVEERAQERKTKGSNK
jgi:DNA-binding transcriptional ArsR family regulator